MLKARILIFSSPSACAIAASLPGRFSENIEICRITYFCVSIYNDLLSTTLFAFPSNLGNEP
ncbi:MAG: hypothetical protein LUQ05_03195, partial [Methanoregula sp.]|nr:hypothetical protein [Methanoregula sp.]